MGENEDLEEGELIGDDELVWFSMFLHRNIIDNLNSMGQTQCCESATAPTHLLNPALALEFIVSLFLFRTFKMTPLSLLNRSLFIWLLARPIETNWERLSRGNLRRQSLCCQLMWRNASNHFVFFAWDRTNRIVVLSQAQERARSCRNERFLQVQQDWNRVWGRMAER